MSGMGGGPRKLGIERSTRPAGPKWVAFRKSLLSGQFRGKPCFLCGHPFAPGQHRELQHHLPPATHPKLAWEPSNLAVVHAAARGSRCQVCGIACNSVAAGNQAPRDELGRPVPWSAEFIARKSAEAKSRMAGHGRENGEVPQFPPSAVTPLDVGRDFDAMPVPGREQDRTAADLRGSQPAVPGSPAWLAEREKRFRGDSGR